MKHKRATHVAHEKTKMTYKTGCQRGAQRTLYFSPFIEFELNEQPTKDKKDQKLKRSKIQIIRSF